MIVLDNATVQVYSWRIFEEVQDCYRFIKISCLHGIWGGLVSNPHVLVNYLYNIRLCLSCCMDSLHNPCFDYVPWGNQIWHWWIKRKNQIIIWKWKVLFKINSKQRIFSYNKHKIFERWHELSKSLCLFYEKYVVLNQLKWIIIFHFSFQKSSTPSTLFSVTVTIMFNELCIQSGFIIFKLVKEQGVWEL